MTVNLSDPQGLAFAVDRALWVNYGGTLVRLPPEDLGGAGSKTLAEQRFEALSPCETTSAAGLRSVDREADAVDGRAGVTAA